MEERRWKEEGKKGGSTLREKAEGEFEVA